MTQETRPGDLTRRRTLGGFATLGLGLPLLAACGSDDGGASPAPTPTSGGSSGGGAPSGAGGGLVSAADVEVGGGVVLPDQQVVVVQPSEGEFKGYSAVCTHQGCTVAEVVDGQIHCPCHDSMFAIEDGSPQSGPATVPLPEVAVRVQGGEVRLG